MEVGISVVCTALYPAFWRPQFLLECAPKMDFAKNQNLLKVQSEYNSDTGKIVSKANSPKEVLIIKSGCKQSLPLTG